MPARERARTERPCFLPLRTRAPNDGVGHRVGHAERHVGVADRWRTPIG